MKKYKVKVEIRLKKGILDAEGRTIERAIKRFGVEVENTRKGKIIEFEIYANDMKEAESKTDKLSRELLINPLTEEYNISIADE